MKTAGPHDSRKPALSPPSADIRAAPDKVRANRGAAVRGAHSPKPPREECDGEIRVGTAAPSGWDRPSMAAPMPRGSGVASCPLSFRVRVSY